MIDNTPETKPLTLDKRIPSVASEADIKDEDLLECPVYSMVSSNRGPVLKSFKPGSGKDNRVIPVTPGLDKESMSKKNKPLSLIKAKLRNEI